MLYFPAVGPIWLDNIDGDNTIQHGQSAVILPKSGETFGSSGNKVEIVQGATTVAQTVTAESASSITITVDLTGLMVPGAATLRVGRPT